MTVQGTSVQFSSFQFSRSVMSNSLRPYELQHARPPCLSPTPGVHSDSTSIQSVMPSSHLILCHPLLLLPPIPPSIKVFSNESTLPMRWQKYWSFSFSMIPSKEIPGLISFRMDLLHLLAVQGTRKTNYLGINLTKETKDLNIVNYKTVMKEIKDDQINRETYHASGLEESI